MAPIDRLHMHQWIKAAGCLMTTLVLAHPVPVSAEALGGSACGELSNGTNGPFDYRNERGMLRVVEAFHFTAKVEALVGGESEVRVGADLDYVLRAFPNHSRALVAAMRWGEKRKTLAPTDMPRSVECYFDRALRFRPDDNVVRMIYATFLSRNSRPEESIQQIDLVVTRASDNAFTHYNAGLLYVELKQYEKALEQAHAALALGFTRPELREQLKAVGKWRDPVQAPDSAASAASAAEHS